MTALTEHFTWAEASRSETAVRRGIDNTIPPEYRPNVERTAALLEEVRALLGGHPLKINSWYRAWPLNRAVGGSLNSVHPLGLAVDFEPTDGTSNAVAFQQVAASALPFDQLIHERTRGGADWIHLGLAPEGQAVRRLVQVAEGDVLGGPMTFRRVALG